MKPFNLSDWALGHRSLVWYFMIAFMAAGLFAYLHLGREEDPAFTIKTMVVQADWPGASPEEITRQVTDGSRRSSRNWNHSTTPRASLFPAAPPCSCTCATAPRPPTFRRSGRGSAT